MKKTNFILLLLVIFCFATNKILAQAFTENFDDITTLAGSGWAQQNNSTPVGITNWFQGTPVSASGPFDAFNGASNAYIAANFNNVAGANTISNWLMTPNRTFRNGDVITFYTRRPTTPPGGQEYPDRLEVRLSTNGASTNVGATSTAVGDFTTLLLSINPTLSTGVYPATWTQYTITLSGLPAPTSGRVAFRYFVTNGGSTGTNSDYIGIDNVVYTPYVCPTLTITTSTLAGATAGVAYSQSLSQTGALGTPSYSVTAGALPPGVTLSANGTLSGTPTATGTFNFTVTVSDNSGCTGSRAYSITVVCGPNITTLNGLPVLCTNSGLYTLVEGSPAGGTYSGTGVTGGVFDPSVGTQTITYDYTDAYGCPQSANATLTVNTAPTVTLDAFGDVCDNAGLVTLSGGLPAGGDYSGTGVTAGEFDPTVGTQTITYTYTDVNNCSASADQTLNVNTAPTVTLDAFGDVCDNAGLVTLSGGLPAGGDYSGTGVIAGEFDPTVGTQTITYTYTDGNNCSASADQTLNVNTAPTVTLDAFGDVCDNAGLVTLSGGLPAGGDYSGTGVVVGEFDPTAGTQTITYTYTDGNNCSASANQILNVNTAPTVTLDAFGIVCDDAGLITLSGGLPAGGDYSGTGVVAGEFDPTAGTQTITYTYTDGNGCTETATEDITVETCIGLEDVVFNNAVKCYPNPTNKFLTVEVDAHILNSFSIRIYNIEGKIIVQEENHNLFGTYSNTFDMSNFSKGLYLLKITTNEMVVDKKIIVE